MNALTDIIGLTISCLIIWVLIFKLYKDYRLETFRDEMFELRDRMFDDAADGSLQFESDGYRLLRRTMNGFLRYGHNLNVVTIILTTRAQSRGAVTPEQSRFQGAWRSSLAALPSSEKDLLTTYFERMNELVIRHFLIFSPELLCCAVLFWPFAMLLYAAFKLSEFCRSSATRLGTSVAEWVIGDTYRASSRMDVLAYEQGG
jgi:hypothetical protein